MTKPQPDNPELWAKAKRAVKARVKTWPSAYASGQVVQEYKRLGGGYKGARRDGDLARWYKERWVDVCAWPKVEACGEPGGPKPYCRPSKRVSKATPVTVQEMSAADRKKMCAKKRRAPGTTMPAARKTK